MITSTKLVHELSKFEFEHLLAQAYNITMLQADDWMVQRSEAYNMHNGEKIVCEVEKCEFEECDEWRRTHAPPNEFNCDADCVDLLCDMANRGIVPEGLYIIDYSW